LLHIVARCALPWRHKVRNNACNQ